MNDRPLLPILRYTLFAVLISLQVLTLIGVLASTRANTEMVMREHVRVVMQQLSESAAENTQRFLAPAERSVCLTGQLLRQGVLEPEDTARLEQYFLAQLRSNAQLSGLYLGRPDGRFLFVKRQTSGFLTKTIRVDSKVRSVLLVGRDRNLVQTSRLIDPNDRYDPRSRPWYTDALRAGQQIWVGPYVFFTSQTPGVTVAIPVRRADGVLIGVVGADIEIAGLSSFLEKLPISQHGEAFIMDREGRAVSFPGMERVLQQSAPSKTLPMIASVGGNEARGVLEKSGSVHSNNHELLEFSVNQTQTYGMLTPFAVDRNTTWLIGVHAPAEDFVGTITAFDRTLILKVLGIGLLTCLLAIPIAFGLTRPLNLLHRQATVDNLTGLLNRAEFLRRASALLYSARKQGEPITVALLDLDGFKAVNDRSGHAAGDAVLTAVGQRILGALRNNDLVGRIGGDEFALVLPGIDSSEALLLVERVRAAIANEPISSSSGQHDLGATIGIAALEDGMDIEELLAMADHALLRGKGAGKSRSLVYTN